MKRWHGVVWVCVWFVSLTTVQAIEPGEALDLLVVTLAETDDDRVQSALMRGMLRGLEGRRDVKAPKGWEALRDKLSQSSNDRVRELAMQLAQTFGDREATQRALELLKDESAAASVRRRVLQSLLMQRSEDASATLETLLDDVELQLDAVRGYAAVENATAPAILLARFDKMPAELRRAVVETLATRKRYATALVAAIRDKTIPREEIPVHVARSLEALLGDHFVEVFGEVRPLEQDREKLIAKYKAMLTPSAMARADASRGRAVFQKTCAACHVLYGEGGKIGPDLTGSNRANLDYILLNSVDPSYDVPEGYRMISIVTLDGRVLNGVIAEEDNQRVILKTVEQPRVVISKQDIDTRTVSPKSMMPDGQLEQMRPREIRDLIKYLRTTEQVELAK